MHFFFILFVDFVALNILVFSCKQDSLCGEIVHQLCQEFQERNCFCCFGKLSSSILLYSFAWSQRGRLAAWKSTSSCCGILYDFSLTHTHRAMSAFPLCPADMLSCAAHFPLMWKTEYINVGQSYRLQSTCLFCWNRLQLLFMLSHTSARSFEWNAV